MLDGNQIVTFVDSVFLKVVRELVVGVGWCE